MYLVFYGRISKSLVVGEEQVKMIDLIGHQISESNRDRKFLLFERTTRLSSSDKILDVGGGIDSMLIKRIKWKENVTVTGLFNEELLRRLSEKYYPAKVIYADATDMKIFEDKSFDIVFSNAVIEHVGSKERQLKFANEIRRVGKRYFVATPNYFFPIEQHYKIPLMHFLPERVRKYLMDVRQLDLGHCEAINLLTPSQMQDLFPEATIKLLKSIFFPFVPISIIVSKELEIVE